MSAPSPNPDRHHAAMLPEYEQGVLDAQAFVVELQAVHDRNLERFSDCRIETFLPVLKAGLARPFDTPERERGFWETFAFWIEQGAIEGCIAVPEEWDALFDLYDLRQSETEGES